MFLSTANRSDLRFKTTFKVENQSTFVVLRTHIQKNK